MRSAAGPVGPVLAAAALVAAAACAHVEAPSGGPVDREAPVLQVLRPDSFAVLRGYPGAVEFVFDERISEQQLEQAVMVSPHTSSVAVDKGRESIRVSLRQGWRPGTIYHVTVLPTVQDLFGNRLGAPLELVFSTGPEIPRNAIGGSVVDRITARPDTAVRVEAIHRADSLVYATVPDSAGNFSLRGVPAGAYLVRAFRDPNRNRARDPFEAGDTAAAVAGESGAVRVALSVVSPDSTPPKAASAQLSGPGLVTVRFDDYLDPAQPLDSSRVQVLGPSGALRVDSVALEAAAGAAGPAGRDTAAVPTRLPSQALVIRLAEDARLVPAAKYRVVLRGIRNVVGLSADAEASFTAPAAPAAPRDSARGPVKPSGRAPAPPNPNSH